MTFRVDDRTATLTFEPGTLLAEWAGGSPEVTVSLAMPTGKWLEMQALTEDRDIYGVFATQIVSWDLEDANGPIPLTLEGLLRVPRDVLHALLGAWMAVIVGRDPKASQPSPTGEPVAESLES